MKLNATTLDENKGGDWELLRDADGKVLYHPSGPLIKHRHHQSSSYKFYPSSKTKREENPIVGVAVSTDNNNKSTKDDEDVECDNNNKTFWASPRLACKLNNNKVRPKNPPLLLPTFMMCELLCLALLTGGVQVLSELQ